MGSGSAYLHPDYGPSGDPSQPYGIPYIVVPKTQRFIDITFPVRKRERPGPISIRGQHADRGWEGRNGDRHAIMVDPSTCTLYELWDAYYRASGSTAGSGAIWKLTSNALRRRLDVGRRRRAADPGRPRQLRPSGLGRDGPRDRVTAECTQQSYVWPARHEAGLDDPNCPPMGARFRLKASFNLPASQCSALLPDGDQDDEDLRPDPRRQRQHWFFQGTAEHALDLRRGRPSSSRSRRTSSRLSTSRP